LSEVKPLTIIVEKEVFFNILVKAFGSCPVGVSLVLKLSLG